MISAFELVCARDVQPRMLKDTGTKNQTPLSFVLLNFFRTNQYEEA